MLILVHRLGVVWQITSRMRAGMLGSAVSQRLGIALGSITTEIPS